MMNRKIFFLILFFVMFLSLQNVKASSGNEKVNCLYLNSLCLSVPWDSPFANPHRHGLNDNQQPNNDNNNDEPQENPNEPVGTGTGLLIALSAGVLVYKIKKNNKKDISDSKK